YGYMFERYRPIEFNNTFEWHRRFDKPHNQLLDIASELGLIGLASWLSLFALAAYIIIKRRINKVADHSSTTHAPEVIMASILAVTASQMLGFSSAATSLLVFVGLGLIMVNLTKIKQYSISRWWKKYA